MRTVGWVEHSGNHRLVNQIIFQFARFSWSPSPTHFGFVSKQLMDHFLLYQSCAHFYVLEEQMDSSNEYDEPGASEQEAKSEEDLSATWQKTAKILLSLILFNLSSFCLIVNASGLLDDSRLSNLQTTLSEEVNLDQIYDYLYFSVGAMGSDLSEPSSSSVLMNEERLDFDAILHYSMFWRNFKNDINLLNSLSDYPSNGLGAYCEYELGSGDPTVSYSSWTNDPSANASAQIASKQAWQIGENEIKAPLSQIGSEMLQLYQSAEERRIPEKALNTASLEDISFIVNIPSKTFEFMYRFEADIKDYPNDWMCELDDDGSIKDYLKSENSIQDGDVPEFDTALMSERNYHIYDVQSTYVGFLTIPEFWSRYKNFQEGFSQQIDDLFNGKPISLSNWIPQMPLIILIQIFPLLTFLVYVMMTLVTYRLYEKLNQKEVSLDSSQTTLPTIFILPQPENGRMGFPLSFVSIISFLVPLLCCAFLLYLQIDFIDLASGLQFNLNQSSVKVPDGAINVANTDLSNLLSQFYPSVLEVLAWLGLLSALVLALHYRLQAIKLGKRISTPRHP